MTNEELIAALEAADGPISPMVLRELLDYNPQSGLLKWRKRRPEFFEGGKQPADVACKKWNTRYAGQYAGSRNQRGYVKVFVLGKRYSAHRIAWAMHYGEWPKQCIDHINRVGSDNRINNLREVSHGQNMTNLSMSSNNNSGTLGVSWKARDKRWVASIQVNRKRIHLGSFQDIASARKARKSAEERYGFHPNHGRTLEQERRP